MPEPMRVVALRVGQYSTIGLKGILLRLSCVTALGKTKLPIRRTTRGERESYTGLGGASGGRCTSDSLMYSLLCLPSL
jgi:hypothetical protein